MKQLTQKYCLISLLEPVEVGKIFSWKDWVLHVTFAGVHFADWNTEMIDEFETLIRSLKSFEAKTLEKGKLGDAASDVVFIDKSEDILNLHKVILSFLNTHNTVFNNPEWNYDGYIPHSTIQKHAQLNENGKITIDNIALVDMFPNSNGYMRKITKIFNLSK